MVTFRCRKCRQNLQVENYKKSQGCLNDDFLQDNVMYFGVEDCPVWIEEAITQAGWTKGKLYCIKCKGRLGSFDFVGQKLCSCRQHLLPPIHLLKVRIDKMSDSIQTRSPFSSLHSPIFTETQRIISMKDSFTQDFEVDTVSASSEIMKDGEKMDLKPSIMNVSNTVTCNTSTILPQNVFDDSPVNIIEDEAVSSAKKSRSLGHRCMSMDPDDGNLRRRKHSTIKSGHFRHASPDLSFVSSSSVSHEQGTDCSRSECELYSVRVSSDFSSCSSPSAVNHASGTCTGSEMSYHSNSTDIPYSISASHENGTGQAFSCFNRFELLPSDNLSLEPRNNLGLVLTDNLDSNVDSNTKADSYSDTNEILEEVEFPPELTCPVCLELFYRPHRCEPCGHIFCEHCLKQICRGKPVKTPCPLCRDIICKCCLETGILDRINSEYANEIKKRSHEIRKKVKESYPLPSFSRELYAQYLAQRRSHLVQNGSNFKKIIFTLCWIFLLYLNHILLTFISDWSAFNTKEIQYNNLIILCVTLIRQCFWFAVPTLVWMSAVPHLLKRFVVFTQSSPTRNLFTLAVILYQLFTFHSWMSLLLEMGTVYILICFRY